MPPGATAASARPASRTARRTAGPGGPRSTTGSTSSDWPTSTTSRRLSSATASTAVSPAAACSPWRPGRTRWPAWIRTPRDSSTRTRSARSSTPRPISPVGTTTRECLGRSGPSRLGIGRARQVVLATNAFPNPLRRLRWSVVPVFDYVLATEPLSDAQLEALRWDPAIGVSDSGNQFHYYQLTPDRRILVGRLRRDLPLRPLDPPRALRPAADLRGPRPELRRDLPPAARHPVHPSLVRGHRPFDAVLRVLRLGAPGPHGLRARVHRPRGGGVALRRRRDAGLASVGIHLTRWSLARADRTGRRNAWLRLLDRLGLGFDS
jgi:hypothetical protein